MPSFVPHALHTVSIAIPLVLFWTRPFCIGTVHLQKLCPEDFHHSSVHLDSGAQFFIDQTSQGEQDVVVLLRFLYKH
jgi:hypothetical protein